MTSSARIVYSKAIDLSNRPRAAPTILVVPGDVHVPRPDLAPPRFKLVARNVERRWRHQVIEHDQMLVAPAERRDRAQVIVIEEMLPECGSAAVKWTIDQLRRQKQTRGRNLRQVQQRAPIDARRDFLAHRVHQTDYPLVILGAV